MWNEKNVAALFALPLLDLLLDAQQIHRKYFVANEVELCTLLNVKTGGCPENCAYCPQSAHYDTGVLKEALLDEKVVIEKAKIAKENGATRFCMGAAWKNPPKKEFPKLLRLVKVVKDLGLETCVTAGMLSKEQAQELKLAGLDYYNHNIDTSRKFYSTIISTHSYDDRLDTLQKVRDSGINVCCGGILGLGESVTDRIDFLLQLTQLEKPPESVTLNRLIPIKNTPLENASNIDNISFIKTVAVARIMMPDSFIRLTAGRLSMSEEMQAMCFMAGANSIHFGEKLLITGNPDMHKDLEMLAKIGMTTRSKQLC